MSILYKFLSKLPNYIRAFGVFHGLRLLIQIEYPVSNRINLLNYFTVPGYPGKICLRNTVSDHSIFWQCIVQKQYLVSDFYQNEGLLKAYFKLVSEGIKPLIIDCGGNIGLSTLFLAKIYPEAIISVIEPNEENFEMLKLNTAVLGDRVKLFKGGIWNEKCYLHITNPSSGSAAFRVEPVKEVTEGSISAFTIDEISKLGGAEYPFILKIDIEGAQKYLFEKNIDWVGKAHLIMLELDDWLLPWQGTSDAFFKATSQHKFDYIIKGETIFCFRNFY